MYSFSTSGSAEVRTGNINSKQQIVIDWKWKSLQYKRYHKNILPRGIFGSIVMNSRAPTFNNFALRAKETEAEMSASIGNYAEHLAVVRSIEGCSDRDHTFTELSNDRLFGLSYARYYAQSLIHQAL